MSGWWARATREQRLAQCRGGAEAGLAASEIAMWSGTYTTAVHEFCKTHGIRLVNLKGKETERRRRSGMGVYGAANEHSIGPEPIDRFIARNLA